MWAVRRAHRGSTIEGDVYGRWLQRRAPSAGGEVNEQWRVVEMGRRLHEEWCDQL